MLPRSTVPGYNLSRRRLRVRRGHDCTGSYTLRLSAADGVHAVAYDAVIVQVQPRVAVAKEGATATISFGGNDISASLSGL